MKTLIDTNVILDVLTSREPYVEYSSAFLKLCGVQLTGLMAASQTTDIFYMLRREGQDSASSRMVIQKLTENVKVVNVTAADVKNALASDMTDYEGALLSIVGKRQKVDYIITRNEKDFRQSHVLPLSPQAFLERYYYHPKT